MTRTVKLMLLKDGKTEWMTVPWGKAHLDWVRRLGYTILMSV
jgi:hypothetical protein